MGSDGGREGLGMGVERKFPGLGTTELPVDNPSE
jgi:hypothetical protein